VKRQFPNWIQVAVFSLLLGASGALWLGQEHVSKVFASFSSGKAKVKPTQRGGRTVPVVVSRIGHGSDDVVIEAIATARAKRFVTLYPEVDGEIVSFDLKAGDRVKGGDVILKLESRAAELAVELAEIKVVEMERMLGRSRQLQEKNVNSPAKVEDSRTTLERARVELEQARDALSKRTMRAPFAGVVGIPKVELGDRVTTAMPIITVDDRSELLVEMEVPEQYLARLAAGQKVIGVTPGFADRQFEGWVERIDSRIEPTSRTVIVRAGFPNKDDLLRPGMSFAVELAIPGRRYPAVPELALQWRTGESYVWRIKDGAVEKVSVRTVKRMNSIVLVDGNIADGDLVVVEGVQRLRPGRAVVFAEPVISPGS
jgi:RND family efflux transporter MFP subunit